LLKASFDPWWDAPNEIESGLQILVGATKNNPVADFGKPWRRQRAKSPKAWLSGSRSVRSRILEDKRVLTLDIACWWPGTNPAVI